MAISSPTYPAEHETVQFSPGASPSQPYALYRYDSSAAKLSLQVTGGGSWQCGSGAIVLDSICQPIGSGAPRHPISGPCQLTLSDGGGAVEHVSAALLDIQPGAQPIVQLVPGANVSVVAQSPSEILIGSLPDATIAATDISKLVCDIISGSRKAGSRRVATASAASVGLDGSPTHRCAAGGVFHNEPESL